MESEAGSPSTALQVLPTAQGPPRAQGPQANIATSGQSGSGYQIPANFTGVLPPGFSGVVPPNFTGVMNLTQGDTRNLGAPPVALAPQLGTGPISSALPQGWVKEAVLSLRSQAATLKGEKTDKESSASSQPEAPDLYKALGLKKGADEAEIKKNYRKLVLKWHPDKHPTNREESDEKIRLINNAYETLGNPLKRQGYDVMLEAIERKKRNQRLETSFIQPRMSIPKAFMVTPLGYPDKFLRTVDKGLRIQSRDDIPGVHFEEFFRKAQFSLWYLPEVNNMVRMRTAEIENSGVATGMNVQACMEGAPTADGQLEVKEAEVDLTESEDPRYVNLIVVASPFSQGAFRFEGAFWPGHYLTFRAPNTFCMAPLVDEVKDITDFYLVDFSTKFKHLTVGEVLAQAILNNGVGENFVGLGGLRSDASVRSYFQNILGCTVWNNKELGEFFEAHYQSFDFDKKRARVRLRSAKLLLIEKLTRCKAPQEVVQAVLGAGQELFQLPLNVVEDSLGKIGGPTKDSLGPAQQRDLLEAQKKILSAVPAVFANETGTPGLTDLFKMYHTVAALPDETGEYRSPVCAELLRLVNERIVQFPDELDLQSLSGALELPLAWQEVGETLRFAVSSLVSTQQRPAGSFLKALLATAKAGAPARPIAEALARAELQVLHFAQGQTAANVLTAMIDHGLLAGEVAMKLLFLQNVPLRTVIHAAFALRKHGLEISEIDSILKTKVFDLGGSLDAVPGDDLVRLFEVAARLKEKNLTNIVSATVASISDWSVEGMVKLLAMVANNKDWENSDLAKLTGKLNEVLIKKVQYLNARLLGTALVAVSEVQACKSLSDALIEDAKSRLPKLEPQELVILSKAFFPLEHCHPAYEQLSKCWIGLLGEASPSENKQMMQFGSRGQISADEFALLIKFVAKATQDDNSVFETMVLRIQEVIPALTDVGRECIGASAVFPGKDEILEKIKEHQENLEKEAEERKKKEQQEQQQAKQAEAAKRQRVIKDAVVAARSRSRSKGVGKGRNADQREERRQPDRREERRRDDRRDLGPPAGEWDEFRRDDRRQGRRREEWRDDGRRDDRGRMRGRDYR